MDKKMRATLCWAVMMVCIAGTANANLIANGSFEAGVYTGDPFLQTLSTYNGPDAISGWTVTGGSIDWTTTLLWQASDGSKSLDLAGNNNGTIKSDAFDTVIGQSYMVTFDMAGNPASTYDKELSVSAGETIKNFIFIQGDQHSFSNMGWTTISFSFIANDLTTQLSFKNISSNPNEWWGAVLDNVRVDPVPEPTTMLLMGIGLAGLIGARRKNKP